MSAGTARIMYNTNGKLEGAVNLVEKNRMRYAG